MRSPFDRWMFIPFLIAAGTLCAGAVAADLTNQSTDRTMNASSAIVHGAIEQCVDEAARDLDSIRSKADLSRMAGDDPPPFRITLNDTFATDAERVEIIRLLRIRNSCRRRFAVAGTVPEPASAIEAASVQQELVLSRVYQSSVSQLISALYHQELTYGEFARSRYEFTREAAVLRLDIAEARQDADQTRLRHTLRQLLYLRFSWNIYLRRVNARQPGTVHIRGAMSI
jgi:hypothetical protein